MRTGKYSTAPKPPRHQPVNAWRLRTKANVGTRLSATRLVVCAGGPLDGAKVRMSFGTGRSLSLLWGEHRQLRGHYAEPAVPVIAAGVQSVRIPRSNKRGKDLPRANWVDTTLEKVS